MMSEVTLTQISQIIQKNDPRDAVGKVLEELHKDLAEIQQRAQVAKQEEKIKLRRIEERISEAIRILSSGDDPALAIEQLEGIENIDPETYELVRPQVLRLQEEADRAQRLRAQSVNITSNGVVV
jgi:hypothetical protein